MSRILVLDDSQERLNIFAQKLAKHDVVMVETATEAIEQLKNNSFDMILLDHDLGNRAFVDSSEPNTGYQVAKFIVNEDTNNKDVPIIIHSLNPVGSMNMKNILGDQARYLPGYWNML